YPSTARALVQKADGESEASAAKSARVLHRVARAAFWWTFTEDSCVTHGHQRFIAAKERELQWFCSGFRKRKVRSSRFQDPLEESVVVDRISPREPRRRHNDGAPLARERAKMGSRVNPQRAA